MYHNFGGHFLWKDIRLADHCHREFSEAWKENLHLHHKQETLPTLCEVGRLLIAAQWRWISWVSIALGTFWVTKSMSDEVTTGNKCKMPWQLGDISWRRRWTAKWITEGRLVGWRRNRGQGMVCRSFPESERWPMTTSLVPWSVLLISWISFLYNLFAFSWRLQRYLNKWSSKNFLRKPPPSLSY